MAKQDKRKKDLEKLAILGGGDKDLFILDKLNETEDVLEDKIEEVREEINPILNEFLEDHIPEDGKDGESIKGDKGDKGDSGKDGKSIKGDKGDKGDSGKDGKSIKGDKGDPGRDGKDGRDGDKIDLAKELGKLKEIPLSKSATLQFKKLFPDLPNPNGGGSGATFLEAARDFDIPNVAQRGDGDVITWNASKRKFDLQETGGEGDGVTLAEVSAASTTIAKSLYSMTSAVDVEFEDSSNNTLLYLDEANARVGIGITPSYDLDIDGDINISAGNFLYYNDVEMASADTDKRNWWFGNAGNLTATASNGNNIGFGDRALEDLAAGQFNTAIGVFSLLNTTNGSQNTGLGYGTLQSNLTGSFNLAIGTNSLNQSTGSDNTAIGYRAGFANTSGRRNTYIGSNAGDNITTGDQNIMIGYDIDAPSATTDGQMSIGNLIYATGVDGTGTTLSSGNVGVGISSPVQKLHIHENSSGASYAVFTNTTTGSTANNGLYVGVSSTESAIFIQREANEMNFYTNNGGRFRIASDGTMSYGASFTNNVATDIYGQTAFGQHGFSDYGGSGSIMTFDDTDEDIIASFMSNPQQSTTRNTIFLGNADENETSKSSSIIFGYLEADGTVGQLAKKGFEIGNDYQTNGTNDLWLRRGSDGQLAYYVDASKNFHFGTDLTSTKPTTVSGANVSAGHLVPRTDSAKTLGTTSLRWLKLWTDSIETGGTITTPLTEGSVVFAGASGVLSEDNDGFFWDDTDNKLSITGATETTIAAPASASGTYSGGGTIPSFPGFTFSNRLRVYAYVETDGVRVYSSSYAQSASVDDMADGSDYDVDWSWSSVAGATGYRLLFEGCYDSLGPICSYEYTTHVDVVGSTTYTQVDGNTTAGGVTPGTTGNIVTPNSFYDGDVLELNGDLALGDEQRISWGSVDLVQGFGTKGSVAIGELGSDLGPDLGSNSIDIQAARDAGDVVKSPNSVAIGTNNKVDFDSAQSSDNFVVGAGNELTENVGNNVVIGRLNELSDTFGTYVVGQGNTVDETNEGVQVIAGFNNNVAGAKELIIVGQNFDTSEEEKVLIGSGGPSGQPNYVLSVSTDSYKAGLYTQNPIDSFDVSGNIVSADSVNDLGSEILNNPEMTSDTDWTKGSGWTHTSGSYNYAAIGGSGTLTQTSPTALVIGQAYNLGIFFIFGTGGTFDGSCNVTCGGVDLADISNAGYQEFKFIATSTTNLVLSPTPFLTNYDFGVSFAHLSAIEGGDVRAIGDVFAGNYTESLADHTLNRGGGAVFNAQNGSNDISFSGSTNDDLLYLDTSAERIYVNVDPGTSGATGGMNIGAKTGSGDPAIRLYDNADSELMSLTYGGGRAIWQAATGRKMEFQSATDNDILFQAKANRDVIISDVGGWDYLRMDTSVKELIFNDQSNDGTNIAAFRMETNTVSDAFYLDVANDELDINVQMNANDIVPETDSTHDLGTTSLRWQKVWADEIDATSVGLTESSVPFINSSGGLTEDNLDFNYNSTSVGLLIGHNSTTPVEATYERLGLYAGPENASWASGGVSFQGGGNGANSNFGSTGTASVGIVFTRFTGTKSGAIFADNSGNFVIENAAGTETFKFTSLGGQLSTLEFGNVAGSNTGSSIDPLIHLHDGSGQEAGFYTADFSTAANEKFYAIVNREEVLTFMEDKIGVNNTAPDYALDVSGVIRGDAGRIKEIKTVTGTSDTLDLTDHIVFVDDDTAGSTVTITLPAVSGNTGLEYVIKKQGSTANVIVDGNASETIDGGTTATLTTQYESITIVCDGTEWGII